MKKLKLIVILLTITTSTTWAQQAEKDQKGGAPQASSCASDGTFTSCTVTCTGSSGTASCSVFAGFSSCTCVASEGKPSISVLQKNNFRAYIRFMQTQTGIKTAAAIINAANRTFRAAGSGRTAQYTAEVKKYNTIIEGLSAEDKEKVIGYFKNKK